MVQSLLLFQSIQLQFLTPTLSNSQMPVTPVSRDLMFPSGLYGHLHSSVRTYTQTHTHMLK